MKEFDLRLGEDNMDCKRAVTTTAIVLAAGQGKRMGSTTAKQYLLLREKPILYYSLKAFQDSLIDEIILVTGPGEQEYVKKNIVELYGITKVTQITEGGKERYHSVYQGLKAMGNYPSNQEHYIFIHDGARPFITPQIINQAMGFVQIEKACVVGMPVKDTIKLANEEGYAMETPKRSLVWMIQTPQVFERNLIQGAYEKLIEQEQNLTAKGIQITDDASVVELLTEQRVKLMEGSYKNIKITTPEDLQIAEAFLQE